MQNKIFPKTHRTDAAHVATVTVAGTDVVVNWNLKHMVKLTTKQQVNQVNVQQGHRPLEIIEPLML